MPFKRIGTCGFCGMHNVEIIFNVWIDAERREICTEWICGHCLTVLDGIREQIRNHGESESQERTPGT